MNKNYTKSNQLLERAKKVTPLGAQTYSKSYRYFCEGNSPAFISRGKGCYVWDVDGNKYIDFICGLGPITVGYNDDRVNRAIMGQLEKGIIFSQPAPISVELSEKLVEIIPCAEMVRFVKNGSDATSAAVRLARAYTGRERIAACGYHGMQDWYIGSTENNKGVPSDVCELTKRFSYNDINSLEKLFEEYPNEFAAVILEPIQGNGPKETYLQDIKKLTHKNGTILIFDEVKSGFWYALGGASEYLGVVPDMVTIGKGMANGMPISAVAGKRDILELIGSKGVFVSTTFGGEALSMAASLETIKILERTGTYQKIWATGKSLLEGLDRLIKEWGLNNILKVVGMPPYGGITFEGIDALTYLDIQSVYQQTMIENGILTLGINSINISHSEKDVSAFLSAANIAMQNIKKVKESGSLEGVLRGGKVNPIFKRNIGQQKEKTKSRL